MSDEKQIEIKGRGRPSLSPTEKERRRKESKKKYNSEHPNVVKSGSKSARNKYNRLTISVAKEFRITLDELIKKEETTITALFLNAVEEKYGITLTKKEL